MPAPPQLTAANGYFAMPEEGILPPLGTPYPRERLTGYAIPFGRESDIRSDMDIREKDGSLVSFRDVYVPGAFDFSLSQIRRKKLVVPLKLAHADGPVHFCSTNDFGVELANGINGLMLSVNLLGRDGRHLAGWMRANPEFRFLSVGCTPTAYTLKGTDRVKTRVITAADLEEISLSKNPAFDRDWVELRHRTG